MDDLDILEEETSDADMAAINAEAVGDSPAPAKPAAATQAASTQEDYVEELKKLAELKDMGIVTEEEFQAKKKILLGPYLSLNYLTLTFITLLRNYALAIALLLASVAGLVLSLDSVELVGDSFEISAAIPTPILPSLSMVGTLLVPAIAIGLLGLIQAAGISQTIPNPDGEYPDPSGDFRGQGISNIASGLFKGLPLGCQPFFAHCDAGDLSGYIDSRNSRGCFYWHHFFNASARTMEDFLPKADQAKRAVVILRLHGRSRIGSTFIQIVERYAGRLEANGGKLMLSGVSQHVWDQLERTETFETIPESDVFKADEALGNATKQAATAAKEWLASLPEAEYTSSSGNDLAR